MTIEERLAKVERELRRVKRRARRLIVTLGLGLGALVLMWTLGASVLSAEELPWDEEQPVGTNYNWLIMLLVIFGPLLLLGWRRRSRIRRRLQESKATINLKCPTCGAVFSAPIMPPPIMHDGVKVGQRATCPSCGNVSFVGIKGFFDGWLFFPAIGLVLSPLTAIAYLVFAVADHGLAGLSLPWLLLQTGFIVFLVFVAVLFFMKKPYAPKLMVALLLTNLASVLLLAAVGGSGGGEIEKAVVVAAIWVPYFLVSKRVKATFGRKGVAHPIPEKDSQSGGALHPPRRAQ